LSKLKTTTQQRINKVCINSGIAQPLKIYVVVIGKIKHAIEIIIEVIPILKSVLSNLYPKRNIE